MGLHIANETSFKKGVVPWNKGNRRFKFTCVTCGKYVESLSNRKFCSTSCRTYVNKDKICLGCHKPYRSRDKRRKFCSTDCSIKYSIRPLKGKRSPRAGTNHYNWKGGVSTINKLVRQMPENLLWRSQVFERDAWICQTFHKRGYLEAHHIKSFSSIIKDNGITSLEQAHQCQELWDISNGITLCKKCHNMTK
jgi:hypothetical protein